MSNSRPLAPETPVELLANGQKIAVMMCSPYNLDDLAVGHLFSRGMISDPAGIVSIGACADLRVMTVVAPGAIGIDRFGLGQVIASGCGSGSVLAEGGELGTVPPGFMVELTRLRAWAAAMFKAAIMYRETGGMHCAALAVPVGAAIPAGPAAALCMKEVPDYALYYVVREDVGRHNAVDKVLGRGFMDRVDFSRSCILTSGRIAADMILKAVAARVPVVVSRSIPTTTACDIAISSGLTIVGRIGDERPIVYTSPERILL